MNRRMFFGIFTLPLAVKAAPAKSADWAAGQAPHVVDNSARVMMAKAAQWQKPAGCTPMFTVAVGGGPGGYFDPVWGSGGGKGGPL